MSNYYSFANGAEIDDATINGWLNTCCIKLLEDEPYWYISSGDTIVCGFFNKIGVHQYNFTVCTNRNYMKINIRTEEEVMTHKFRFRRQDLV